MLSSMSWTMHIFVVLGRMDTCGLYIEDNMTTKKVAWGACFFLNYLAQIKNSIARGPKIAWDACHTIQNPIRVFSYIRDEPNSNVPPSSQATPTRPRAPHFHHPSPSMPLH